MYKSERVREKRERIKRRETSIFATSSPKHKQTRILSTNFKLVGYRFENL